MSWPCLTKVTPLSDTPSPPKVLKCPATMPPGMEKSAGSSGHCSVESCGIRNSTRSAKQKASITYMITTFTGSNPYSWHESSLQHQEHHVRFHSPLKMTDTRTVFARNRVDSTSAERMSLTPTPMALWPYAMTPTPHRT